MHSCLEHNWIGQNHSCPKCGVEEYFKISHTLNADTTDFRIDSKDAMIAFLKEEINAYRKIVIDLIERDNDLSKQNKKLKKDHKRLNWLIENKAWVNKTRKSKEYYIQWPLGKKGSVDRFLDTQEKEYPSARQAIDAAIKEVDNNISGAI